MIQWVLFITYMWGYSQLQKFLRHSNLFALKWPVHDFPMHDIPAHLSKMAVTNHACVCAKPAHKPVGPGLQIFHYFDHSITCNKLCMVGVSLRAQQLNVVVRSVNSRLECNQHRIINKHFSAYVEMKFRPVVRCLWHWMEEREGGGVGGWGGCVSVISYTDVWLAAIWSKKRRSVSTFFSTCCTNVAPQECLVRF